MPSYPCYPIWYFGMKRTLILMNSDGNSIIISSYLFQQLRTLGCNGHLGFKVVSVMGHLYKLTGHSILHGSCSQEKNTDRQTTNISSFISKYQFISLNIIHARALFIKCVCILQAEKELILQTEKIRITMNKFKETRIKKASIIQTYIFIMI